ncbi:MAG: secretion protein HlyD [Candidatus Hydrogenedentes bacterium]|nr:secretion protein HlyD [Candidatus Hydrogenedentota bacterium]
MKKVIPILILVAAAIGAAVYYRDTEAGIPANILELYGNVDIRQVDLGFRVPGRLSEMNFEEGDRVEAGAVLARLDAEPFEEDLARAQAQVAAEQANLQKLETGSRPQEIEQARAQVAARETTVANARQEFDRQKQLQAKGATSTRAFEAAEAHLEEAQALLTAAQETLKLAEEGFREEDIAVARARVRLAEADVARAQTRLDDTLLTAPARGTILTRAVEPGSIVREGATAYALSLESPVWVRAYVPEPDLGYLHPGQEVEVITDTRPEAPYHGQVGFISPEAEFTPKAVQTPELRTALVYRMRIVVRDVDEGLRQGMPVTVRADKPEGAVQARPAGWIERVEEGVGSIVGSE